MAFWDDAKNKMKQAMRPKQQEGPTVFSNRADGGFSGYVPKMKRDAQEVQQTGYQQARPQGMENMMPVGVDPSVMQGFQPVGGQTGQMPPQQPQQGMPQQAASQGFTGRQQFNQPPMGQPMQQMNPQARPQGPAFGQGATFGQFQQQPQATRPGFGQPAFQQNAQQPPMGQQGFTGKQPNFAQQPMAQQMPPMGQQVQGGTSKFNPQAEHQTFAFPGESFMVDGHAYKLVCRVAQITGVPSCFRVIEFMYNNEAVIVNAEQITDLVEADRCMDLIFGAACAMKQRLMRVSGKQIYLITPPQVYVAPFEPLRRAGMADIERRWPGAMQNGMQPQQAAQPVVNNVQPFQQAQPRQMNYQQMPPMGQPMGMNQAMPVNQAMPAGQPMGAAQPMAAGQYTAAQPRPFAQRQDDFAGGMGRRAARNTAHTNSYTDFGGFGMKTR